MTDVRAFTLLGLLTGFVVALPASVLAQAAPYTRVTAGSPEACAQICGTDRMCGSWSFGGQARSYGQSDGAGICALSASPTPRGGPGVVAGLPMRTALTLPQSVPQATVPATGGTVAGVTMASSSTPGWSVAPAPWLRGASAPLVAARPAAPVATPAPVGARIEFDQPSLPRAEGAPPPPAAAARAASLPTPQLAAPLEQAPAPRTMAALPPVRPPQPAPLAQPATPPAAAAEPAPPAASARSTRRPGSGTARNSAPPSAPPPAAQAAGPEPVPVPAPPPARPEPQIAGAPQIGRGEAAAAGAPRPTSVQPGPDGMIDAAEAYRARNYARMSGAESSAPQPAAPGTVPAAPSAPPPGIDPRAWAAARGPDGMVDAAELRRQQLALSRQQGVPAYSVQAEWEAVEASRAQQRAQTGSPDNRVIPGSVPIEGGDFGERITPEQAAAQERGEETGTEDAEAAPVRRRPGAGAPRRPRSSAVNSAVDPSGGARVAETAASEETQSAEARPRRPLIQRSSGPLRRPRPAPEPTGTTALDREPTLQGGPAG